MKTIKVLIAFINYGPYHIARAKELLKYKEINPIFLELSSSTLAHPWSVRREDSIPLITLLNRPYERITKKESWEMMKQKLEELDPDVFIGAGFGEPWIRKSFMLMKLKKKATVLFFSTLKTDRKRFWIKENFKKMFMNFLFDAALVGGKKHKDYLVDLGYPENKIWEYGEVVDNSFFVKQSIQVKANEDVWRQKLSLPKNYFLYIGRMDPEKNLSFLLNAYKKYQLSGGMWDLILIGKGKEKEKLMDFVISQKLYNIHFFDYLPTELLPPYYALAKAFILPSLIEPWGLVVNEAMACGLPVIVSKNCGCVSELVSKENGFIFDPHNSEELALILLKISQMDKKLLASMSECSQKKIELYSPQNWAKSIVESSLFAWNSKKTF
ncbi:hypothetical protein A946_00040 [Methylacidiphilum kamchatkense Kam1]|uniref:Glycosyltransferase involved in cell wall biosynthesis n=1 Tax=Methylacidiphilum kamchatkense Kam1 TaxID=1202785 RepID=A0A0C1RW63_9BACT|nr:glycosyltransferase [Methylacidiphilum kamchatkense]KIE59171.1 hypothetical protein A946_00040 [Methylacidiphilum kamchatkense Kam1]QDQ42881.1 glycosyltransferase involved in cell wall biosynthesis [Methylacidiphilum kamchatkense Kam1]